MGGLLTLFVELLTAVGLILWVLRQPAQAPLRSARALTIILVPILSLYFAVSYAATGTANIELAPRPVRLTLLVALFLTAVACSWIARRTAVRTGAGALLVLIAALGGSAQIAVAQAPQAPIRALYVTGGGFHDFAALEQIVPPGISARSNVVWTIDRSADTSTTVLIERHRDTRWADQFDVVVYNMSFSWVVDPQWIERIAHAHRDKGVAAVVLHGATHSYRRSTTLAWKEMMGASSMRHDAQREYGIERIAPEHPIMKALPKGWAPGRDELYDIERTWPTMTTLAQGWSVETEKHHPVAWTNNYGRARVFVTPMGHNLHTMSDPAYLDLITRGLLWTQDKLQADGTPAAGYGPAAGPR